MEVIRRNKNSRFIKDGTNYYVETRYNPKPGGMRYIYKRLVVDNSDTVISAIMDLYDNGYKIFTGGVVADSESTRIGKLSHYILSAIHSIPVDEIRLAGVLLLHDKSDFRERNLYCPLINGHESVTLRIWRKWDELVYRYKSNGTIGHTDYSPKLAEVLCAPYLSWHTASKSSQYRIGAVLRGTNQQVYLYQIRMMEELYGLPTDEDGFRETLKRYRAEYSDKGLTIDHLDGDIDNNRLSNLFTMPLRMNIAKAACTRKIKAPYFWNSKRVDDKTIEVEAGREAEIILSGRFELEEYMEKLKEFVNGMEGCK